MPLKRPTDLFFKNFATSTGLTDMRVVGASTNIFNFEVSPSTAKFQAAIRRVNIVLVDGNLRYDKFGGLVAALTNGLKFRVLDSSSNVLIDFLDGGTIKTNADFGLLAGIDNIVEPAAGDDAIPIRWTIGKSGAEVILQQGDRLQIQVTDGTTLLTAFKAQAQGYYYDKGGD